MLSDHQQNICFASLLGLAVALAGWQGHRAAAPEQALTGLTGGSYQRQYESTFADALPSRGWSVEAYAALRLALFNEVAEGAVLGRDGWIFTAEEFETPALAEDPVPLLRQARAELAALGVQLVPVILPDKARVHADRLPHRRSAALQNRYAAALDMLRAEGFAALDTRPAFQAHGFLRGDTHWQPEAARAVAEALAQQLGADPAVAAFVTHSKGQDPFRGDLMVFAETGRFADWVALPLDRITHYETLNMAEDATDAMALFADTRVPVALIGTSYSAKADFHFEGFLKSALGQDVLNLAQIGKGPFAPMRDYLTSPELHDSPPDIVIWEIPERYILLQGG